MLGSGYSKGSHVVAREDLHGWAGSLGYPVVKRGTRGIVRETPRGLFSHRYLVEFSNGHRESVEGRQLKPALLGHGEAAWSRHQKTRQGIHLGMLILALPAIVGIVRYLATGGSVPGLIAAVPAVIIATAFSIFSMLGLPAMLMIGLVVWLVRRFRHHSAH
jgi:hypothetical protein